MHEIWRNDLVACGVCFEPTLTASKELLDFIVSNPVVLLVGQHRNQDVQVREQLTHEPRRPERDRKDAARAQRRHLFVQRMAYSIDLVAEWLEQAPKKQFAAAAWDGGKPGFKWQWRAREIRHAIAPAGKSRIEPPR